MELIIKTDGGARGNPGSAGIGYVLSSPQGDLLFEHGEYVGEKTNNQAEYLALIAALTKALEYQPTLVKVYLDSELVVKQLSGEYKVKNQDLAALYLQVWQLKSKFHKIEFHHVYREQNKRADFLVNQALDQRN